MTNDQTIDDMMTEFINDMNEADDVLYYDTELAIIIDNYIDELVAQELHEDCNIFDNDEGDGCTPFYLIVDKVFEKIDEDLKNNDDSYVDNPPSFDSQPSYYEDDYIDNIDFSDIDPESFQLSVRVPDNSDEDTQFSYGTTAYDSIFNA